MRRLTLTLLIALGAFAFGLFFNPAEAQAQSCSCTVNVNADRCDTITDPFNPGAVVQSCIRNRENGAVSGNQSGDTCEYFTFSSTCEIQGDECILNTGSQPGYCSTSPPPPPGTFPPPPTGGGGCGAGSQCFSGVANCGAVGRVSGSGSCEGGICCGGTASDPGFSGCRVEDVNPARVNISVGEKQKVKVTARNFSSDQPITGSFWEVAPTKLASWLLKTINHCCTWGGTGGHDPVNTVTNTLTAEEEGSGTGIVQFEVGAQRCTATIPITVEGRVPWFQARDGEVITSNRLNSRVPTGERFIESGTGGFPGVAIYGRSAVFGQGDVSETGWRANTTPASPRFGYPDFEERIPVDFDPTPINSFALPVSFFNTRGEEHEGYHYYMKDGNLTMNGDLSLTPGRKVVVFVDGDLTITGNSITLPSPSDSFLMFVVNGDITLNPNVTALDGVYFAMGDILTGRRTPKGTDSPLRVNGMLVSYGEVRLQRSLPDNTAPAEVVNFSASMFLNFPSQLSPKRILWREVRP